MSITQAFEAILSILGSAPYAPKVVELRQRFQAKTGVFAPDDPWFEARSRAFWDDAITAQGFARTTEAQLSPEIRKYVRPFERAHRGLFEVARGDKGVLHDTWSGARFCLSRIEDEGLQEAMWAASGFIDGRLVGADNPPEVALLPGAIFHPADASTPIVAILAVARRQGIERHDVLDALLRMERTFNSLSRVRASHAYRPEALGASPDGIAPRSRAAPTQRAHAPEKSR